MNRSAQARNFPAKPGIKPPMNTAQNRMYLALLILLLISAACGGADSSEQSADGTNPAASDTDDSGGASTGSSDTVSGDDASSDDGSSDDSDGGSTGDPSGGLSVAGVSITDDIGALPNDDAGMAAATAIFNEAGLDFNAPGLLGGFGTDQGEVRDFDLCREVDAEAVGAILGLELRHHPKPRDLADQTRQPHLSCPMVAAGDENGRNIRVNFYLSPVVGLENPDPDGIGRKWSAGGGFDDFVTVEGLGDSAEWMLSQTNLPERSVLYVEEGNGSGMLIGEVRNGDVWEPIHGPSMIFALAEIASSY